MCILRRAGRERPMNGGTVFLIRLWHYGTYGGEHALRTLTVKQIARLLNRTEKNVRSALLPPDRDL